MPIYKAPTTDMMFILKDVLQIENYSNIPSFEEVSYDLVEAVLSEGAKVAEEVYQPLNQVGDEVGCTRHEDGSVTTPPGFKEGFDTFRNGGWMGLTMPPEYGGQGLPYIMAVPINEMVDSANHSLAMYPGLTMGASTLIANAGTDEMKQKYLPKMITGEWTGTMNLTEPHCGTDLGQLKSKAELQDDGTYKITGTKIFISAGEHDMSENIIHPVLARLPGAPDGVRGISLFIVPKFLVNDDGSLGERNAVTCGSIEHKMGIHGNVTAVMNYDGATGYMIGEENRGLIAMFIMVNAARLGVSLQGMAQSEVSYQNAVEYAKDRLQGRSLTGVKNPDGPADPIIVHPDVRRMLLEGKAFNEGARMMAYWAALNVDISRKSPDEAERQKSNDLLELLTPVMKGFFTEMGYKCATQHQQVFGGHGYIKEWGMEQFVRDARITMMYEGANGIQALDLVARKLPKEGGRGIRTYFAELEAFIKEHEGGAADEFVQALKKGVSDLQQATMWLMENATKNPDEAGAASMSYMFIMGYVTLGHMWAKMAVASHAALAAGTDNPDFHNTKIKTGRFYITRMMPETSMHLDKLKTGAETLMDLDADQF